MIKKLPPEPVVTLRQFYDKRNNILVIREYGGLGDILMHRMMFEDFKRLHPDFKILFACPRIYHCALEDHPYIDRLIDSKVSLAHPSNINTDDYMVSYNTSTACTRHELRVAPFADEHRSDIWAAHCGVRLENHNMHINLTDENKAWGKQTIQDTRNGHKGPCVVISPISAQKGKNLLPKQMEVLVTTLRDMGCFVCAIHSIDIPFLQELKVPVFFNISIPQWMSIINASDYIISVDSAAFHFAGGIGKPLMGIFTYADGVVYGKYYDFVLVQKHRKDENWNCGPCYNWGLCPKTKELIKPCLTEITSDMLIKGIKTMLIKWPNRNSDNSIKLAWDSTT